MLISRKEKYFHVFGCISKNFLENIFWCLEKNKENTNPEKHKPQPRKKSSTTTNPVQRRQIQSEIAIDGAIAISPSSRDRDRRRDLAKRRSRSQIFLSCLHTRSCDLGSSSLAYIRDLAISDLPLSPSIVILIWHDLARERSRSTTRSRDGEIAFDASPLARARALSLSLIFRKCFEGKIEV